jgi:parallel beta-helix repeat protein
LVVLLFILSGLIPISIGDESNQNNIIYVDDDGTADYTKIQDAIDNASRGDTVFVYNGVYNESKIDIDITINLIGENRNYSIININKNIDGIYIRTKNVNISGFMITNASRAGINLDSNKSDNVSISNNLFINNAHGIHPYLSNKNLEISNNIFINNSNGFTTVSSAKANIHHNILINNNYGMSIFQSSKCNIYNNHISNSNKFGIRLYGMSRNNNIHHNNFINNSINAFFVHLSLGNKWDNNFWNEPKNKPVLIFGSLGLLFPNWINIDWHPAQEPYDIY